MVQLLNFLTMGGFYMGDKYHPAPLEEMLGRPGFGRVVAGPDEQTFIAQCLAGAGCTIGFVALVTAVILSRPPRSEWFAGGWDPGLYQNAAVVVERANGFTPQTESIYERLTVEERSLFGYQVFPAVPAYLGVAARHGMDPCQMAIAFCRTRPFPTIPIIGATTLDQLRTNIGAASVTLSAEVLEEIAETADGLMVARGDLGVMFPLWEVPMLQKRIIKTGNRLGKPVITATQMLLSMVSHSRPSRAEATDVANAILDGTDAVMLSAESAVGRFPEDAVAMLAKIAEATESSRGAVTLNRLEEFYRTHRPETAAEAIATVVEHALGTVPCDAVIVPTRTGSTARMIARFKPPVWTVAVTADAAVSQGLAFSYGIHAIEAANEPEDWRAFAAAWAREHGLDPKRAILVAGPSATHPDANYRIEFMRLAGPA